MNDRIKDLALEVIVENIASEAWVFNDAEFNKFAELIVKECITVVQTGGGMCGAISSNNLKQHFYGVEE